MKRKSAFSLVELSIVILIIGIIIAGITSSSTLIASYRISTAQTLTQSSPINSITDLYVWLETSNDNATNLTDANDGDALNSWYDINPQVAQQFHRNFTQADSHYFPTFKYDAINALPAVSFKNSAFLSYFADYSTLSPEAELTIFMVSSLKGEDNTQIAFFTESSGHRISLQYASGVTRFDYDNATAGKLLGSANVLNNNVITMVEKTSNTQNIYINGSLDSTQTSLESFSANTTAELLIGTQDSSAPTTESATIDIGEIAVFTRSLTKEEKTAVIKYLSNKWKIPVNLSF